MLCSFFVSGFIKKKELKNKQISRDLKSRFPNVLQNYSEFQASFLLHHPRSLAPMASLSFVSSSRFTLRTPPLTHRTGSSRTSLSFSVKTQSVAVSRQSNLINLAIDGADEVDPNLDLVKGRGGALLRGGGRYETR